MRAAPISGNIDNPEGGLDALMQVRKGDVAFLLCEKKDTTLLEVFGSHLKVPPPGDGLWGEGWVEGGGEEGDHLHHRPGASDCKTHFMLIL